MKRKTFGQTMTLPIANSINSNNNKIWKQNIASWIPNLDAIDIYETPLDVCIVDDADLYSDSNA